VTDLPAPSHASANLSARRLAITAAAAAIALAVVMFACSLVGQAGWAAPGQTGGWWTLRLMRILAAATVGAALAVAGAALQSLLRNALASPFVLGISSGAGVGVLIAMTVMASGLLWLGIPAMAAAGALVTVAVVYLVAQRRGRLDPYSLLLTGVIVNSFNGAILLFIYLYASPYVIADYISWAMGAISESHSVGLLAAAAALTVVCWVVLFALGHAFNVQSLGDDVATSSGISVHRLRLITFILASALTAAAVALAGPVGFVGLIVPHICRFVVGSDHRRLMIVAGFVGAALLVVADTFCRSTVLWFHQELPVGLITALSGGPFFLVLLRRRFQERTQ